MNSKAVWTFNALSIFVLFLALFLMQPNKDASISVLQQSVRSQLSVAWQEVWTDQPILTPLAQLYNGIESFYQASTDATIALIEDFAGTTQIATLLPANFDTQPLAVNYIPPHHTAPLPPNFMTEPAIPNIVPAVAGTSTNFNAWNNIFDAATGQEYCLAIYNGEVNKYLGACKNDYH